MRRVRLIVLAMTAALLLAACQDPNTRPMTRQAPGEWDASLWDSATWE